MDFDTLCRKVKEMGAVNAAVIRISDVKFCADFRAMCEANVCGNYGKCWMCPPYVGAPEDCISKAKSYDYVLVYQTIGQLEDSYDFEGMMDAAAEHNKLSLSLTKYFKTLPFARMMHLGAGGCHVCKVCAKKTNEPCRFPDLAISSLETYCINVSELARSSGMKYVNGEDTVTYFGALLFSDEKSEA